MHVLFDNVLTVGENIIFDYHYAFFPNAVTAGS